MIMKFIFYKSPVREFRSPMQLGEAKKALQGAFVSPQVGLGRRAGILGEFHGDGLKMAYMHPNLLNPWHSIFVGRFERSNSGSCLIGYYRNSPFIRMATLFVILFSILAVFVIYSAVVDSDYTARSFVVAGASLVVFFLMYVMVALCVRLSKVDEKRIDSIVEIVLDCKISILQK